MSLSVARSEAQRLMYKTVTNIYCTYVRTKWLKTRLRHACMSALLNHVRAEPHTYWCRRRSRGTDSSRRHRTHRWKKTNGPQRTRTSTTTTKKPSCGTTKTRTKKEVFYDMTKRPKYDAEYNDMPTTSSSLLQPQNEHLSDSRFFRRRLFDYLLGNPCPICKIAISIVILRASTNTTIHQSSAAAFYCHRTSTFQIPVFLPTTFLTIYWETPAQFSKWQFQLSF